MTVSGDSIVRPGRFVDIGCRLNDAHDVDGNIYPARADTAGMLKPREVEELLTDETNSEYFTVASDANGYMAQRAKAFHL